MVLWDYIWQYCTYTGKSTGSYIVFYLGGPINHCTQLTGPVYQSSADSEYNAAWTTGIDIEHYIMLNNELLNKDPDVVPEQSPLTILDNK